MLHNNMAPNPSQLANLNINIPSTYEGITYPLYHRQAYAAAGQSQLAFFNVANGQNGLTYADTNMDSAGMISSPNLFVLTGIEIEFLTGVAAELTGAAAAAADAFNDVVTVVNSSCYVKLTIGAKQYVVEPLNKFPPSHHIGGVAAVATTVTTEQYTALYGSNQGNPYQLSPFLLPANQTFNFTINWPALVPTPSTKAGVMIATLNGWLYRPAQ